MICCLFVHFSKFCNSRTWLVAHCFVYSQEEVGPDDTYECDKCADERLGAEGGEVSFSSVLLCIHQICISAQFFFILKLQLHASISAFVFH